MRLANTMVVTLRPSRAWVQSDCSVYIALPSPTMQITLRSGQATAAPVATGVENPIEPPMFCSQSWGAAAAVGGKKPRPVVSDSSTTMAFSGIARAMAWAIEAWVKAPVGLASSASCCGLASCGLAPMAEARASHAAAQHPRGLVDGLRRIARALLLRRHLGNAVGLVPGGVGGQDQGGDLRRRTLGRGDGGGAVARHRFGVRRGANPGRHRPGQAL